MAQDNQREIQSAPNVEWQDVQYPFDGQWMPDVDAALIGPRNFAILTNLRYNDKSLEGVNGYTEINSTSLVTYTTIDNGAQLRCQQGNTSSVLVHAKDPVGGQGRVYVNYATIGSTGDFDLSGRFTTAGAAYFTDVSSNLVGRFSPGPQSSVIYCNGQESMAFFGNERKISAAFLQKDDSDTSIKEVTSELTSILTSNYCTLPDGTYDELIIMTTVPVQSFKFYVGTHNAAASTMTVSYWNGTGWSGTAGNTDGTAVGGVTLAQTGSYTFNHTSGSVKLKHFQELYLFAYKVTISAGSATIYNLTCDPAFIPVQNVWDGVYRQPIQFQVFSADHFEDYTLQVNESSDLNAPIGAILDGLLSTDYFVVMFEEQMAGIRMTMLGDLINKATETLTVQYWDGSTWQNVSNKVDGTLNGAGTVTLNKTGLISWTPTTTEQRQTLFGSLGYAYKFIPSGTLSGTKGDSSETVLVDLCAGIPVLKDVGAYDFPAMFKNRVMLCGFSSSGESNRVDFSAPNAPDVYNGSESSDNGLNSLYFGGNEPIRGAVQVFNRFGASIFSMFIVFKDMETYILTGDTTDDFQVFPVSTVVGCPAPLTICTTEVNLESGGENYSRNFAVWLSHSGPLMFDGAVIAPVKGIENYFDPNKVEYINWSVVKDVARAWVDPAYKEWNLLIPTSGSTTANTWLVYDLQRRKWFRKDPGAASMPQCGFVVMNPATGEQMAYGGIGTGNIMRLEYGTTWDGVGITQKLKTGDFWPSNNIWDLTTLRKFKLISRKIASTGSYTLYITYYGDSDLNPGQSVNWVDTTVSASYEFDFEDTADFIWTDAVATTMGLTVAIGLQRVVRKIVDLNYLAASHAFDMEVTTTDVQGGFQPIVWGVEYRVERKDNTAT